MRGERGQVTLFIIVGIVVLVVIGLLFLITKIATPPPETQTTINTGVLDAYLASCLDTVVNEQLRDLQNGALDFSGRPSAIVGEGETAREMLYGITRNQDTELLGIGPIAYPAPQYPDTDVTAAQAKNLAPHQDGYFGDTWWPAICSKEGRNNPYSTFRCRYYESNPPGSTGESVQELLEARVLEGVRGCANTRGFADALGVEITRVGEPNVTTLFTFDAVLVELTYPIEIAGESTVRRETFRKGYEVRLLPLLQFITDLSRAETRDVMFNMTRDASTLASYKQGFFVLQRPYVSHDASASLSAITSPHADLITVFDNRSFIDGESYAISFLVEHRAPMLEPLTTSQWEDIFATGRTTVIAYDPDEGVLSSNPLFCLVDDFEPPCGRRVEVRIADADGEEDWEVYREM